VKYVEKHENRAGERRFGSPPTVEDDTRMEEAKKDLIKEDKGKSNFKFMCS
jgi:hypothetical protein